MVKEKSKMFLAVLVRADVRPDPFYLGLDTALMQYRIHVIPHIPNSGPQHGVSHRTVPVEQDNGGHVARHGFEFPIVQLITH